MCKPRSTNGTESPGGTITESTRSHAAHVVLVHRTMQRDRSGDIDFDAVQHQWVGTGIAQHEVDRRGRTLFGRPHMWRATAVDRVRASAAGRGEQQQSGDQQAVSSQQGPDVGSDLRWRQPGAVHHAQSSAAIDDEHLRWMTDCVRRAAVAWPAVSECRDFPREQR